MRILFMILLAFMFASCGKKRSVHITATNVATGERYPGLEYRIVSSVVGAESTKGTKIVASGVLDANGEAVVELREKRTRRYVVRVIEPENTCYNKQISMFFGSPFDENGHFNFEFAPCAYLKININNTNCQGAGDAMSFQSRQSYTEWEGWNGDRTGCYSYTSPDFFQVPAGLRIYQWRVNRNGVITTGTDSIFLNAGESGTFNLNY
ncbi:hypothetical protein D3C87_308790 [compost metagenome]